MTLHIPFTCCGCVQCVQAAQITFEDYFMADLHIEPLKIVGYEGVFGSLAMICVLLPTVYFVKGKDGNGLHEDTLDSLHVSFQTSAPALRTSCTGTSCVHPL